MPTEKRQRQREGRQYRRAVIAQAQRRRKQRRQGVALVVAVALVAALVLLLHVTTKPKATNVATKTSTTTTTATSSSTTSTTTAKVAAGAVAPTCPKADGSSPKEQKFTAAPPMCINTAHTYVATVQTDVGTFQITLDPKEAPKTVNNFVFLARYHFYDGVVFHRVIPGFVVQGGDPTGTGQGGPGYTFADELPKAGAYKLGSVAMANSGPNTNGSQFFIITGSQGTALPPSYSLFGQVTSGGAVIAKISADGTSGGTPKVEHHMAKVTITES